MISRLYNLSAVLAIATLLSTSGFSAYLLLTGRLDAARAAQIARILRDGPIITPPAAPTSQPAPVSAPSLPADLSPEGLRDLRMRSQLDRALLERAAADVAARQALLDQTLRHLLDLQAELDRRQQASAADDPGAKRGAGRKPDAGAKREIDYLLGLPPKAAKEHVLRTWAKDRGAVVRMFLAVDPGKGKAILKEFKTETELGVLHELLEEFRLSDANPYAATSGTVSGERPRP